MGYGSIAAQSQLGRQGMIGRALVLGLLATSAVVSVILVVSLQGGGPFALFGMSALELDVAQDPMQDLAAGSSGDSEASYGEAIRKAMLAASYDDSVMAQARRHESAANDVVSKDEAQLNSLYSGMYDSGDPLGLSTGHLPTLEGLTKVGGRFSSDADIAASNVANSLLGSVTDTQLAGLQSELNTLSSQKRSILDSLTLQRQSTAVKAAHDATFADSLRLRRAQTTASARAMRDAIQAARIAQKRAKEASIIEQNEQAIARIAQERISRFGAYRNAAMSVALQAEANLRNHAANQQAARTRRYRSTMGAYTQQLQKYVAEDMSVLGKLKTAEESAAFGPRLHGSVWRQYPVGNELPDIDPEYFMGDAPYRNETTLPEFKSMDDATQLSQQSVGDEGHDGDSIIRVMKQADAELAELDLQKRKYSPSLEARLSAVHQKVAAQLQQLQSVASKEGFSSHAPQWDKNQKIGDAMRLQRPALAEAKEGGFTSFPKASLKSVEASDGNAAALDDGALIRHAKEPVASMAIPLGAHQDASKGHGAVKAPRPTLVDSSTEANAVRADGSHNSLDLGSKVRAPAPLHMPHVA